MADEEQSDATDEKDTRVIHPLTIYLKDISFETPNSPEIFKAKWEPQADIQMDSSNRELDDDYYEIVHSVTLTITLGEKIAYLAEVHQAGIFLLSGLTPELLHRTQYDFCLNFLHPYAVATLLDLGTRGGFPQFLMPPIYFKKLYAERFEKAVEASQSETS